MPGQDLVAPGNDGVDYVVELAKLAGGVEVGEPVESFEGAIVVVGLVEAVEFLEGISAWRRRRATLHQLYYSRPRLNRSASSSFRRASAR